MVKVIPKVNGPTRVIVEKGRFLKTTIKALISGTDINILAIDELVRRDSFIIELFVMHWQKKAQEQSLELTQQLFRVKQLQPIAGSRYCRYDLNLEEGEVKMVSQEVEGVVHGNSKGADRRAKVDVESEVNNKFFFKAVGENDFNNKYKDHSKNKNQNNEGVGSFEIHSLL